MSITKILAQDSKEVSNKDKVDQIAEVVSSARKSYGNSDASIKSPSINTVNGYMEIKYLEDNTKLELVKAEVTKIKVQSIEAVKDTEGLVLEKVIEEAIATSPVLVNIADTTEFTYL